MLGAWQVMGQRGTNYHPCSIKTRCRKKPHHKSRRLATPPYRQTGMQRQPFGGSWSTFSGKWTTSALWPFKAWTPWRVWSSARKSRCMSMLLAGRLQATLVARSPCYILCRSNWAWSPWF